MMDEEEYTTRLGYTLTDIGKNARELLYKIVGKETTEWDAIPEGMRDHWIDYAEVMADTCARELELSWSDLVHKAHSAFHGKDCIEEESELMTLVWEALCRHTINLITADDHDDLAMLLDSLDHWKEWIFERSNQHGGKVDGHGVHAAGEEDPGEEWDGN